MDSDGLEIVPTVLVHGGAGEIPISLIQSLKEGVKFAARIGYESLIRENSPLEAVHTVVEYLEGNSKFNAGHGAVLTWDGKIELDAAIMNGTDLSAGCVAGVHDILHPIDLARSVMDKTKHKFLAGRGAMSFARDQGFQILDKGALITPAAVRALEDFKNSLSASESEEFMDASFYGSVGTVGAVAIDKYGNVAAATSTGGLTGKMAGRIGDSPVLGAGTYADNALGAISMTGHGESIMCYNAGSRILYEMKYEALTAQEAAEKVLEEMNSRFSQRAGAIIIGPTGDLGIHFTASQMSWAYQRGIDLHYGVDKDEDLTQIVGEPIDIGID